MHLPGRDFVVQSDEMDNQWASENLQVIRTLMERAAVYRRALAPIMSVAGVFGMVGATVPCFVEIASVRAFAGYWMAVAMGAMGVSFLLVRRQALRAEETFWSPPTRRVTRAFLPAAVVGLAAGVSALAAGGGGLGTAWDLSVAWTMLYGCGLHAAGFFTVRGIKLFGWIQIVCGAGLWVAASQWEGLRATEAAHYVMGTFFGVGHLAYGIYLYFTESSRKPA
jgi:hypothetical protein